MKGIVVVEPGRLEPVMGLEARHPGPIGDTCNQKSQNEASVLPMLWVMGTVAGECRTDVNRTHTHRHTARSFAHAPALKSITGSSGILSVLPDQPHLRRHSSGRSASISPLSASAAAPRRSGRFGGCSGPSPGGARCSASTRGRWRRRCSICWSSSPRRRRCSTGTRGRSTSWSGCWRRGTTARSTPPWCAAIAGATSSRTSPASAP